MSTDTKLAIGFLGTIGLFFLWVMVAASIETYICYQNTGAMSCKAHIFNGSQTIQLNLD